MRPSISQYHFRKCHYPVNTGRKLNVLSTLNLRLVSTGFELIISQKSVKFRNSASKPDFVSWTAFTLIFRRHMDVLRPFNSGCLWSKIIGRGKLILPPEVFDKKAVLNDFAIFTGKYQRWSIFLLKQRLQHRCFPGNIEKFLTTC